MTSSRMRVCPWNAGHRGRERERDIERERERDIERQREREWAASV